MESPNPESENREPAENSPTDEELKRAAMLAKLAKAREAQERDPVSGKMKAKGAKKSPLTSDTAPLREVLEWVLTHEERDDTTHQQRYYRQIKDNRPVEFHRMFEEAQKVAASGPVEDEGSDKVLDLVEEMLAEGNQVSGGGHVTEA